MADIERRSTGIESVLTADYQEPVSMVDADGNEAEEWKTIPGYGSGYQVSNLGRVRSVDRYVWINNDAQGYRYAHLYKGRLKSVSVAKDGGLQVKLHFKGERRRRAVARLVAQAFVDGLSLIHI